MTLMFILAICTILLNNQIYGYTLIGTDIKNSSPNILLLIVDDLRPTINSYGDSFAITPNIDKIAKEGVIFTNAFAQQALCGPSRTSFLTSRRPDTTKLVDVHYYWRRHAGNYSTLSQYFKEHGYYTQSVGKIFHPGISSNHNDDQPYSWSGEPYHPSSQIYKNSPVCPSSDGKLHSNIYCPVKVKKQPEGTLPDIQSTTFALKWLQKWAKNQIKNGNPGSCESPFLLAVGFHKPHIPLKFPMEFLGLYPIDSVPLAPNRFRPKGLPLVAWNPWNDLRRRDDISSLNISFPFGPISDNYSRYIKQGYYAATSYMDSLLGLIVSYTLDLFPNTIVTILGDHGWSLGEHQEWSKFSNYEVATKVPFIISLPQDKPFNSRRDKYILKEASRLSVKSRYFKKFINTNKIKHRKGQWKDFHALKYKGVVELLDLFPTLVDLAGLPTLPKCPLHSFNIRTCTEGMSLSCIVNAVERGKLLPTKGKWNKHHRGKRNKGHKDKRNNCPQKIAALSQYPRPGVTPSTRPDSDQPRLNETKIMGYSLRTNRYRYTSWYKFNYSTFAIDLDDTYGEELYDHINDEEENHNIIATHQNVSVKMRNLLKVICK